MLPPQTGSNSDLFSLHKRISSLFDPHLHPALRVEGSNRQIRPSIARESGKVGLKRKREAKTAKSSNSNCESSTGIVDEMRCKFRRRNMNSIQRNSLRLSMIQRRNEQQRDLHCQLELMERKFANLERAISNMRKVLSNFVILSSGKQEEVPDPF